MYRPILWFCSKCLPPSLRSIPAPYHLKFCTRCGHEGGVYGFYWGGQAINLCPGVGPEERCYCIGGERLTKELEPPQDSNTANLLTIGAGAKREPWKTWGCLGCTGVWTFDQPAISTVCPSCTTGLDVYPVVRNAGGAK